MNRRKALNRISKWGISSVALIGGIKLYYTNRNYPVTRLSEHKELISILTDLIIPRTDTPGAKDANVSESLMKIISNCADSRTQQTFINGLFEIESIAKSIYGVKFKDCDRDSQNAILQEMEEKEQIKNKLISKVKNKLFGKGFFSILKEYTVECFFTSELGATQSLQYDYIPGKYSGCIAIQKNQKCWATH